MTTEQSTGQNSCLIQIWRQEVQVLAEFILTLVFNSLLWSKAGNLSVMIRLILQVIDSLQTLIQLYPDMRLQGLVNYSNPNFYSLSISHLFNLILQRAISSSLMEQGLLTCHLMNSIHCLTGTG